MSKRGNCMKQKGMDFYEMARFCIRTALRASKKYFFLRIALDGLTLAVPFLSLWLGKAILNLIANGLAMKLVLLNPLLILAAALLLCNVFSGGLTLYKENLASLHSELIRRDVEIGLAEKAAGLDLHYFDSYAFYDQLMDSRSSSMFVSNIAFQLLDLLRAVIQTAIAFVLFCGLSVWLAVLYLVAAVPAVIANRRLFERLYFWQRERLKVERKMGYVVGICSDRHFAKEVRLYGLSKKLLKKYGSAFQEWFLEKSKLVFHNTKIVAALKILPELCGAIVLILIGVRIMQGSLSMGDYALYTGLMGQLSGGVNLIVNYLGNIFQGKLRVTNHIAFLKWENKVADNGTEILSAPFTVSFDRVSFRYAENEQEVLREVSFSFSSKDKVALVGTNGSGKSTIVKLLLRFYDVTAGEIQINGKDIRSYTLSSLRAAFSVLFQDYPNYAFTVRESVSFEEQGDVWDALKKSGAAEMVSKLPHGADTYLTKSYEESGCELSGGQWQKLALARTLYRGAPFLIMDEPSAALDAQAEDELFRQIEMAYADKGILLISHRLSNVVKTDCIFVLENGCLVEHGTHEELMLQNGQYAGLFRLQAEKYQEAAHEPI